MCSSTKWSFSGTRHFVCDQVQPITYLCSAGNGHCTTLCCSSWSSTAGRCAAASGGHFPGRRTFHVLSHSLQLCQAVERRHLGHSALTPRSTPAPEIQALHPADRQTDSAHCEPIAVLHATMALQVFHLLSLHSPSLMHCTPALGFDSKS